MDDAERDLETESLDRIMRARTREVASIADGINGIAAPWLSGAQDEKAIVEDLDKFYNENK